MATLTFKMAAARHREFSKFGMYLTVFILSFRAVGCWVMAKEWSLIWRLFSILNLRNFHILSCGCRRVRSLLLCTKFYQNWITRFASWRP